MSWCWRRLSRGLALATDTNPVVRTLLTVAALVALIVLIFSVGVWASRVESTATATQTTVESILLKLDEISAKLTVGIANDAEYRSRIDDLTSRVERIERVMDK